MWYWQSVVIETASGVTFLDSVDILIGTGPGVAVLQANIATATNNGATTSVVIETSEGDIIDTEEDC